MSENDVYLHLVPVEHWEAHAGKESYLPEHYAEDGFIHTTIGEERLLAVGNSLYTADPRPMYVLDLDPSRIQSEVRFDDPERVFPHIYGPLNTDAVVRVRKMERGDNGAFLAIGPVVEAR
jgi:uncharacterized protein (DUF952 family)